MSAAGPVLRFDAVGYVAGGRRVIDRVSFALGGGERVAIVGANGSGKSTLARLALGLSNPSSGQVYLFGAPLAGTSPDTVRRLRSRVGLTLQGGSLLSELSVEDNLRLGMGAARAGAFARLRTRMDRALIQFGLEQVAARSVDSISSGERRRLELARAFLRDPDLLILDDPFEGADSAAFADLETRVAGLLDRRPRAVLLLTGDEAFAHRLTGSVFVLSQGVLAPRRGG